MLVVLDILTLHADLTGGNPPKETLVRPADEDDPPATLSTDSIVPPDDLEPVHTLTAAPSAPPFALAGI